MSETPLSANDPAAPSDLNVHLENWDNEGGHHADAHAGSADGDGSAVAMRWDRLRFSESKLTKDFVDGTIGISHNTFAHRLRYLRQDRARLRATPLLSDGPLSSHTS